MDLGGLKLLSCGNIFLLLTQTATKNQTANKGRLKSGVVVLVGFQEPPPRNLGEKTPGVGLFIAVVLLLERKPSFSEIIRCMFQIFISSFLW